MSLVISLSGVAPILADETRPQIELICCDLAGTTVDYGSTTPAIGFQKIFKRHHLEVTAEEVAGPMGKKKNDHIRDVLNIPHITAQWKQLHGGAAPTESDVESMTAEFVSLDKEIIPQTSTPITGVPQALQQLKNQGIKIAYTTGYPRVLMDLCLKNLLDAATPVDAAVAADEVAAGRPAPFLLQRCMVETNVQDVRKCMAIGDTVADVLAGKNAGFITVGVSRSGMLVGLTPEQQAALPQHDLSERVSTARAKLFAAGADYVINDVSELPALVSEIQSGKTESTLHK